MQNVTLFMKRKLLYRKLERQKNMLQTNSFLIENVINYPERIAAVGRQRSLTYAELNKEANCLANALTGYGIQKGDKVAILVKNGLEWLITWYAVLKLGVVLVPLHERAQNEELVRIMQTADCRTIIYGDIFEEKFIEIQKMNKGIRLRICIGEERRNRNVVMWSDLFNNPDYREAQQELSDDDPAIILFTSGTTGRSKGVMRTRHMIRLHAEILAYGTDGASEPEVMLTSAKLYHAGGIVCVLKMAKMAGTLVLPERIDPIEILGLIDVRHVTQLMMLPPIVYERLYNYIDWRKYNLTRVKEVCISAGKCTPETAAHLFKMFPNCRLHPSWGSTETSSVTGMLVSKTEFLSDPDIINSVGRANAMTEIRIVDETGKDATSGTAGEAVVRSPVVFSGYLDETGSENCHFIDGGWFKTGDLMIKDEKSGCYYFVDRIKDIIKTGGENVAAAEVEKVILKDPAVMDCAVVGVEDKKFGEGIAAAIVLKPGYSMNAKELLDFCGVYLPNYKKPRYAAFVDRLPRNSVGKVVKDDLKDHAEELFQPLFE